MVPAKRLAVKKRLILLLVPAILAVWILVQIEIEDNSIHIFVPHFQQSDVTTPPGFLINTPGCRIPEMHPFDPSVKKFIYPEDPIECDKVELRLVESNMTHIYLNEETIAANNITNLTCCYTPFWRVQVDLSEYKGAPPFDADSRAKFLNVCIAFEKAEPMNEYEFVKVVCSAPTYNDSVTFIDYHSFTPLKESIEESKKKIESNHVSVLIIGVDAVSRLNLHRQMPQAVAYLKNELNAVEMLGYNKVEDNTFPNLVPVLTGLTEEELVKDCWPTTISVFDNCTFLWKNYSQAGYRTCFAEDASWMGIFQYVKYSFCKQPTDYYWRIFNKFAEDEIGFDKRLNAKLCLGPRKTLDALLDYMEKFSLTMLGKPSFSFIWGASLTHDYLNLAKFGENSYKDLLHRLSNKGVFNQTVLVFMSDHGMRFGAIRNTYQGHLEERLPFLFFAFPKWFNKMYTTAVGNLHRNIHRLTSPFDLHETLLDLVNLDSLTNSVIKNRTESLKLKNDQPRGISLFLPILPERTCKDAGISEHWCSCHQTIPVALNDSTVVQVSEHLVVHINNLVKPFSRCTPLHLNRILSSRLEQTLPQIEKTDKGLQDYIVTIETMPGGGMFEATVRYNTDNTFKVMGTISRTNMYGSQSACINNYRLRLYCFCNSTT